MDNSAFLSWIKVPARFDWYPTVMKNHMLQKQKVQCRKSGRKLKVWVLLAVIGLAVGGGFYAHRLLFVRRYGVVAEGKLYRSRQPHGLQYPVLLHRQNFKRIINLRSYVEDPESFTEEQKVCKHEGIDFVNIPVSAEVPSILQVERFLHSVDTSPGSVLVHCAHGRNRAGMMSAAYRVARQGVPVEQAFREELTDYNANPECEKREKILDLLKYLRKTRELPATDTLVTHSVPAL